MRVAAPPAKSHVARTEQIILFRVSGQVFAVSSASVQEVRSVDSLSGAATEINQPTLRKVRHVLRRGDKALYVVSASAHFGLPAASASLVFVLRKTRTALLVDGMDKMATMSRLQALPPCVLPRRAELVSRIDGFGSERDTGGEPRRVLDRRRVCSA